ncbi:hypothetical protein E4T89_05295 [Jeotgalicoccus nanhaiensis]|uniref:Uncharacterized protein n=1 Tax=Jeotgalicoccus nanhaiensis TaxID=568603 RepID=A0ABR9XY73_9STAP|nr:hypothetical protein [Jeotgalicoccus nanhaiensis]MBF0753681.1 hypothetical protein [Jeotgalicoccus nanhaiensis]TFU61846.1 hypothetical protein E4T89_05295 [Jeotgalicoccus nanhaiensis]
MKERNKSKMTVIILFILMLISIALLIVFIMMAANNLEENQGETSEVQSLIEAQISSDDILPTSTKRVNISEQKSSDQRRLDELFYFNTQFTNC